MAGLNPGEAKRAVEMVMRAKDHFGLTIFWIEHVMAIIMDAAERLIAINYGQLIADGSPEEVINNEVVIEAYLGKGWRQYA
jgi:branched-chain amino acid transport system ATP-binding protein